MNKPSAIGRRRALISSAVLDLPEHRAAAIDACLQVGIEPLVFETFSADESDPLLRCIKLLDQADIYIGIIGFRYGFVPPGQNKSLTEIEYERAAARVIPRLLFIMSDDHPVRAADVETGPGAEKLSQFKAVVRREVIVTEFRSPDALKAAVVTGLVNVLRDESRSSEPATALLLLPFEGEYQDLRLFLSRELSEEGVRVIRLDHMLPPGAAWANAIAEAIRGADLVVVDITSANPNVMYELGYVHALRKPTIILSEASALQRIPSDISGFQLLTYDKGELEPLRRPLRSFLREYAKEGRR